LLAERAQVETSLQRLAKAPRTPSDNPYADPVPEEDKAQLERRLASINVAIANRKKAAEQRAERQPKLDPAVNAEWLRLLNDIARAPEDPPKPAPRARFTAELTPAPLPTSPVKPDRPRVLLVGLLLGLATGIIAVVGRAKVALPRRI